jgi:hypothetical protein
MSSGCPADLFGRITQRRIDVDRTLRARLTCIAWRRTKHEKLVAGRQWLLDPSIIGSRIAVNGEDFAALTAAGGRCGSKACEPQAQRALGGEQSSDLRCTGVMERSRNPPEGIPRQAIIDWLHMRALALRCVCFEGPGEATVPNAIQGTPPGIVWGAFTGTACSTKIRRRARRRFCAHQQQTRDILVYSTPVFIKGPGRADAKGLHGRSCRACAALSALAAARLLLHNGRIGEGTAGTVDRSAKAPTARRRHAWSCAGLLEK